MGVRGFKLSDGSVARYNYHYLKNAPENLSDFNNDLFGNQREVYLRLTEDSFVYNEELGFYTFSTSPSLPWLIDVTEAQSVLGCALAVHNNDTESYDITTEEDSPYAINNGIIVFLNFTLLQGLRPTTTGYEEADEFWIICADPNSVLKEEGYLFVTHKYFKKLSAENVEEPEVIKELQTQIEKVTTSVENVVTSFVVEDVTLSPSMFSEDSTYAGYPYIATLSIEGVKDYYLSDVIFAPPQAESGIFASITKTLENTLILYSREIPEEDIIIPIIEFRNVKGLSSGGTDDDITDGDVATDEEVGDIIDDIFGDNSTPDSGNTETPDSGDDDTTSGDNENTEEDSGTTDGDVATDEEVKDIIDGIFG